MTFFNLLTFILIICASLSVRIALCYEDKCEGVTPSEPSNPWGIYSGPTKEQLDFFLENIFRYIPKDQTECTHTKDMIVNRLTLFNVQPTTLS